MTTPRQIAEAFSGHRFSEAYPALAPDVRWTSPGQFALTGREAVIEACEATLAELASGTAEFRALRRRRRGRRRRGGRGRPLRGRRR